MRSSAVIKEWLTVQEMFQWLQSAVDEETYKRRLVIWLTWTNKIHAAKIAELLGISKQTVWLWINQYNKQGPQGLERHGRGGRRWGFLTIEQEDKILKSFIEKTNAGQSIKPIVIKEAIEKELNKKVSMSYIYRLLGKHRWYRTIAQSTPLKKQLTGGYADFQKISRPWSRSRA